MASPNHGLEKIQRWMQRVVTDVYGVEAGIGSPDARSEIDIAPADLERVVLPSVKRTSIQRLEVYANAYYARLLECLQNVFPVLTKTLGEELFHQFALHYLQRYPPTSYTLDRLADHFVQHLEETRPADDNAAHEGTPAWPDFIIDLARLEWHIDQVFDGPGLEERSPLTPARLRGINPDDWPQARLIVAPCLRLLSFRFPVNDFFSAVRSDEHSPLPQPRPQFVALTRRDYVVRRIELTQTQHDLLLALTGGTPVGEAIARAAAGVDDMEEFSVALGAWFQEWAAAWMFEDVAA